MRQKIMIIALCYYFLTILLDLPLTEPKKKKKNSNNKWRELEAREWNGVYNCTDIDTAFDTLTERYDRLNPEMTVTCNKTSQNG